MAGLGCPISRRTVSGGRGVFSATTTTTMMKMMMAMMMVMMSGYGVTSMNVLEVLPSADNQVSEGSQQELSAGGAAGGGGVALQWGIADTTASAGRLFRYHIPSDAFKGPVQSYEVVEAGKDSLPSWLRFQAGPGQNVLQGVPTPGDAGQVFLQVTARGSRDTDSATDVFSITVNPDTPSMSAGQPLRFKPSTSSSSSSSPEVVRCKREEPETVATMLLVGDLQTMPAERRLDLLASFLSHMGLAEDMVKMVPASGPLHDDSALVTGTGDASVDSLLQQQAGSGSGAVGVSLSWLVGCGKVERGHFPALHKLDDDSSSGMMGRTLGVPVVGWRVTNSRLQQQQQHALKRRRRQARATATPVVTLTPPSATDDSMTRSVIDMSSPTFTIEPTPTQPDMPKTTTTTPMPPTTPKDKPPTTPSETKPTTTTTTTTTTTQKPTKKPVEPREDCVRPTVNEGFSKKTFLVGEVVDFQFPENLFDACGMGGTSKTKLTLFQIDDQGREIPLAKGLWLQFDQRTQTLRGMPLEKDAGRYPMALVAMLRDRDYITTFQFEVIVRKARGRKAKVNHKMSMKIDTDFVQFTSNVENSLDLAGKVAGVFGDKNASRLTVTDISEGSVVFSFTNNSLSGNACPVGEVTELADKLVTEDGHITAEAAKKLEPWVLSRADVAPAGSCEGNPDFPTRSGTAVAKEPKTTDMPKKTPTPATTPGSTTSKNMTGVASAGAKGDDNIWITTVVPAVVIVAILLIALLVACILYRKKRKGKMNLEEQNTFVNKGAPVIFPDELDEKPSDSTKPLLIEGSPPAAPPEYHRGDSEEGSDPAAKETTPPTDEVDAEIEDATSPLYQPPPPVPSSSGKQARPHVQQPYRSQPPEIHP